MKHTPGPWEVAGPAGAGVMISAPTSPTSYIAVVYGPRVNPSSEADAHLISAAPDLLEALKRIVADYKCYELNEDATESVRIALAAIAKAEGGAR